MRKFNFLVVVLLIVIVIVPFSSGELFVSPSSQVVSTPYFVEYVGSVNLSNLVNPANNLSIDDMWNVQFSNLSYFSFPKGVNISRNSSVNLSYSIMTNSLFNNQVYVSTISYFTKVPFTPVPNTTEIKITSSGVVPSLVTIRQNDSIRWNNTLTQAVEIRDLGSGFGQVNIPALSSVVVQYPVLKSQYSFYVGGLGFTGGLVVKERENFTFSHDSSNDRTLSITLSSVLQNSVMQVNQLGSNISIFPNETYADCLIEIRNQHDALFIRGINLSVSSSSGTPSNWVSSNFSPNNFDLQAGGIQRIIFNISALNITQTSQTNKTYNVVLNINSANAGSTMKVIPVFVKFKDFSVVGYGNNYSVTTLGINETIDFCLKNMNNQNFRCRDLETYFQKNITKVVEVPQNYLFSEWEVAGIKQSAITFGNVSEREENERHLVIDLEMSNAVGIQNVTSNFFVLKDYINRSEFERDEKVRKNNVRFWVLFSLRWLLIIIILTLWVVNNKRYYDALEEARQL